MPASRDNSVRSKVTFTIEAIHSSQSNGQGVVAVYLTVFVFVCIVKDDYIARGWIHWSEISKH